MRIKEGYILRKVANQWIVVPLAAATVDFNSMVTLNETGVLLWNALENECDREMLLDALKAEYKVDREIALPDIEEFLRCMDQCGFLENFS